MKQAYGTFGNFNASLFSTEGIASVGPLLAPIPVLLCGFAIGFANQALARWLPSTGSWPFTSGVYLDSAVFTLVVVTLLLRPGGLFVRRGQRAVERV
jgi:branched-subunit amino acid ABC-type transport system permease component